MPHERIANALHARPFYVCVRVCADECVYVPVCVCVYVHVYVYVCPEVRWTLSEQLQQLRSSVTMT